MSNSDLKLPLLISTAFDQVAKEFQQGLFNRTNNIRNRVVFLLYERGILSTPELRCDFYHAKRDRIRKGRIDLYFQYNGIDYYFEFDKGLGNTKSIIKLKLMKEKNPLAVCVNVAYVKATKEVLYHVY